MAAAKPAGSEGIQGPNVLKPGFLDESLGMPRPLLWCCVALVGLLARSAAAADAPNIVFILADDVGYGDLGCYGGRHVPTPNLDRLATEGRRFTDAHSAAAVCTPSRYALLTGEYPFRRDLWGPAHHTSRLLVDVSQTTLASLLDSRGYHTACFGKWHLGFGARGGPDWNAPLTPGPLELGFDHYFGIPVVSSSPPYVWVEDHGVVGIDAQDPIVPRGVHHAQRFPEKNLDGLGGGRKAHEAYRDREVGEVLARRSRAWIRDHRDGPFFLYVATPHIHHPFTPAERFVGSTTIGRYGDYLAELDWMVGEILRELDDLNVRDDTLVIFSSDNGGMLNIGGQDAWRAGQRMNGDLLGFKFDAWEGGHRVPFIARWPGRIPPGTVSDELICLIDMLATCAGLTGSPLPAGAGPDSIDILPAFVGDPPAPLRRELVVAPHSKKHLALREGHWMYIGARGGGGFMGTKPGDHALGGPAALAFAGQTTSDVAAGTLRPDAPAAQLYDLASDPRQSRNVILEHPDVAGRMARRLAAIRGGGDR